MNSASFHARVVVAILSVVVELGSALSSMFARSGLMRLFMFIWPMIGVGIRACQGLGGRVRIVFLLALRGKTAHDGGYGSRSPRMLYLFVRAFHPKAHDCELRSQSYQKRTTSDAAVFNFERPHPSSILYISYQKRTTSGATVFNFESPHQNLRVSREPR
jgi:hypothetical protein